MHVPRLRVGIGVGDRPARHSSVDGEDRRQPLERILRRDGVGVDRRVAARLRHREEEPVGQDEESPVVARFEVVDEVGAVRSRRRGRRAPIRTEHRRHAVSLVEDDDDAGERHLVLVADAVPVRVDPQRSGERHRRHEVDEPERVLRVVLTRFERIERDRGPELCLATAREADERAVAVDQRLIVQRGGRRGSRHRRVEAVERSTGLIVRRVVEPDREALLLRDETAADVGVERVVPAVEVRREDEDPVRVSDRRRDELSLRVVEPHGHTGDPGLASVADAITIEVAPDRAPDGDGRLIAEHLEVREPVPLGEPGRDHDAADARAVSLRAVRRVAVPCTEPVVAVPEAEHALLVDVADVVGGHPYPVVAGDRGRRPVDGLGVERTILSVRVVVVVELLRAGEIEMAAPRKARAGPVGLQAEHAARAADAEQVTGREVVGRLGVGERRRRVFRVLQVGVRPCGGADLDLVGEPVPEPEDEVAVVGDLDVGEHRLRVRGTRVRVVSGVLVPGTPVSGVEVAHLRGRVITAQAVRTSPLVAEGDAEDGAERTRTVTRTDVLEDEGCGLRRVRSVGELRCDGVLRPADASDEDAVPPSADPHRMPLPDARHASEGWSRDGDRRRFARAQRSVLLVLDDRDEVELRCGLVHVDREQGGRVVHDVDVAEPDPSDTREDRRVSRVAVRFESRSRIRIVDGQRAEEGDERHDGPDPALGHGDVVDRVGRAGGPVLRVPLDVGAHEDVGRPRAGPSPVRGGIDPDAEHRADLVELHGDIVVAGRRCAASDGRRESTRGEGDDAVPAGVTHGLEARDQARIVETELLRLVEPVVDLRRIDLDEADRPEALPGEARIGVRERLPEACERPLLSVEGELDAQVVRGGARDRQGVRPVGRSGRPSDERAGRVEGTDDDAAQSAVGDELVGVRRPVVVTVVVPVVEGGPFDRSVDGTGTGGRCRLAERHGRWLDQHRGGHADEDEERQPPGSGASGSATRTWGGRGPRRGHRAGSDVHARAPEQRGGGPSPNPRSGGDRASAPGGGTARRLRTSSHGSLDDYGFP